MLGVTSGEGLDNLHANVWQNVGYFAHSPLGPRLQSGAKIDPEDVTIDEHEGIRRLFQAPWICLRQHPCVRGQPTDVFIEGALEKE